MFQFFILFIFAFFLIFNKLLVQKIKRMIFYVQAHALSLVFRKNIRADAGGLLCLQLRRILQSPLQRRRCSGASAGMQTTASSVALESICDVLPSLKGNHAETFRGNDKA